MGPMISPFKMPKTHSTLLHIDSNHLDHRNCLQVSGFLNGGTVVLQFKHPLSTICQAPLCFLCRMRLVWISCSDKQNLTSDSICPFLSFTANSSKNMSVLSFQWPQLPSVMSTFGQILEGHRTLCAMLVLVCTSRTLCMEVRAHVNCVDGPKCFEPRSCKKDCFLVMDLPSNQNMHQTQMRLLEWNPVHKSRRDNSAWLHGRLAWSLSVSGCHDEELEWNSNPIFWSLIVQPCRSMTVWGFRRRTLLCVWFCICVLCSLFHHRDGACWLLLLAVGLQPYVAVLTWCFPGMNDRPKS